MRPSHLPAVQGNENEAFMRRLKLSLATLGVFIVTLGGAMAEENAAQQELRDLRQAVQQQSKQIESLAEQVGRLTRMLEAQKPAESAAASSVETPKPAADPATEAPKAEAVPKAEPVSGGGKHVVAKGETLTSIAKQYNISIADLKNTNKIENERKIQIGQILIVPTPKTSETPDKKENP
jgi:LysM repeat protein